MQTSAPAVIITLVSKDLKLVSVYSVFNMVITGLNGVMNIFTNGLIASFGEVIAKGEIKVLQKAYREFEFTYLTLITAVYSITFVVIMPFIRLYTRNITDANYDLPLIGFLFVLNALLFNIKTPQAMLALSAGLYRETRWRATIQSGIIVVGGVILTPFMGLYGVLLALIASNVYRTIDLLFFTPKYVTHLPVRGSAFRLVQVLLASAAVFIPFYLIGYQPKTFPALILYGIIVSVASAAAVLLSAVVFERRELIDVLRRLNGTLRRKK
ncbi:MAG: hypothetical protein BWY37_02214 [Firmicutes bacterium ADurb.Bin262]|nr:MAG: hypothetical protein BWY37_02214 [Firmicutes bacterium ADurb.Bin262]